MDKSKDALGVLKHQAFQDLNSLSRTAIKFISDKRLLQYKLYYKPHTCPRAFRYARALSMSSSEG